MEELKIHGELEEDLKNLNLINDWVKRKCTRVEAIIT